ncbi:MAG: hypothetical protein JWM59_1867, partial [Verrucomicrobiales bacterium]|nr:hypothetical protein [Verrucomicrobiales bacterium]
DGEWVPFRMIMWEAQGGDSAALYWSVEDGKNGVKPVLTTDSVPGTFGALEPKSGVANSRKDTTRMQPDDLVPASDLRHPVNGGGTAPGLKADIFLGGNPGTIEAMNIRMQGNPAGSVTLPNIFWQSSAGQADYPSSGQGSNVFGDAGANLEARAGYGYSNYGVNLTGEILIPGKAQRTALPVAGGDRLVLFKDGVGDFAYLEVDGQVLINDNEWTSPDSTGNGGGHVSLMDVSNPKFDDGEWVSFRMTTWEGSGLDSAALYWSARDTNGTLDLSTIPGTTIPGSDAPAFQATGTAQVGSNTASGRFGTLTLPGGDWLTVLDVANTGTTIQRLSAVTVTASKVTSFTFNPATRVLNLSFTSAAGSQYALEYTIGFQAAGVPASASKWTVVPSHSVIAGAAGTTAIAPLNVSTLVAPAGLLPDAGKCFFRIRKL